VTAPIPVRVLRYRCPHCPRTGSSKARITDHISRCWTNPAAHGCKTCRHYRPGIPGEIDTGWPGEMEHCAAGVSLTGRPACEGCGGANWLPTGETFRPRLATGGPVYAQCTTCGGKGAEVKAGPIVGCDRWQPAADCGDTGVCPARAECTAENACRLDRAQPASGDLPKGHDCPDHPGPLDDARNHVCRLRPIVRPAAGEPS
jgi:hypothetical protein